jgi:xylulokinase
MKYLLGIDLGTSSLKSLLIDFAGNTIALESKDYQFDSPHPGYAEQDPEVWWRACVETVQAALHKSGIDAAEIAGVSFSGQMHGLVPLDENYQVVRPSILHCDARSSAEVESLNRIFDHADVERLMMNPIFTGFLLVSLLWVKNNEPENYRRIRYVCLPKDYVRFKMTGVLSSENADASGIRYSKTLLVRRNSETRRRSA